MKRELLKEINNPDDCPPLKLLHSNSSTDDVKAIMQMTLAIITARTEKLMKVCLSDSDEGFIFSVNNE